MSVINNLSSGELAVIIISILIIVILTLFCVKWIYDNKHIIMRGTYENTVSGESPLPEIVPEPATGPGSIPRPSSVPKKRRKPRLSSLIQTTKF